VAQANDRGDLFVGVRKDDNIRQRGIGKALAMTVLITYRARCDCAITIVGASTG
jgi:hypothetical protein